jgi:hypothetical protein
MYERPRRRVRRDDHSERTDAPLEPVGLAPATILSLQRSVGNAAVARLVAPARPTLARAPHKPKAGMKIKLGNETWTVDESKPHNPMITISKPKSGKGNQKEIKKIDWAGTDFKIIRENSDLDHDMRGAQGTPAENFLAAKEKALAMIKEKAISAGAIKLQQQQKLKSIKLSDFVKIKTAQWELTFNEGADTAPNRVWKFTIDADNPLPESDQEPHVGWTAEAPTSNHHLYPVVPKATGHIWLEQVTKWRT